jgi:DNA (cytosine-5)-methyltransferase 1
MQNTSAQLQMFEEKILNDQILSLSEVLAKTLVWLESKLDLTEKEVCLSSKQLDCLGNVNRVFFIWENVKGTFSSNDGADFWAILNAFTNIGNYRLEWQLLNTDWVLPQNRERIYLVGHLAGRSAGQIFPFTENDRLSDKPKRTKEGRPQTKTSTTVDTRTGYRADSTFIIPKKAASLTGGGHSGGLHSDMTVIPVLTPNRLEKRQNGRRFKEHGESAFTLNCQDQHGIMIKSNAKKGFEKAELNEDSINFSIPTSETRRGRVGNKKAQTLDTQCNQGVAFTKNYIQWDKSGKSYKSQQDRAFYEDGKIGCIPSNRTENKVNILTNEAKIRRLTEIECERLQGFPDDWTKYGNYDGEIKEISRTQRYKMCGNAVTTKIVKAIGKRIILV